MAKAVFIGQIFNFHSVKGGTKGKTAYKRTTKNLASIEDTRFLLGGEGGI